MCHNAEKYVVIETVGPENGYKRDNYSLHLVTNKLCTANKQKIYNDEKMILSHPSCFDLTFLESDFKCQNVSSYSVELL